MGLRPSSRLTSSPLVSFPSCSPPFLPRPLLLVHRPLLSFSISLSSSSGTLRLPPTTRHCSHPRFWRHQAPLALQRPPPKGGSPSRWPSLGMLRLGRPLSCRSIGLVCSLDRTVATPTTSASAPRQPPKGGSPSTSWVVALSKVHAPPWSTAFVRATSSFPRCPFSSRRGRGSARTKGGRRRRRRRSRSRKPSLSSP
jgi:hypothetical protein